MKLKPTRAQTREIFCYGILAITLLIPASAPVRAQGDGGRALERAYGVVGRDTAERAQMNDELDRVVGRISKALGYKPRSAKILGGKDPRQDKDINALALPDGRIYVLAGLLTAAEKTKDPEASVAFVVGHEITHVVRKHSSKEMKRNILGALGGLLVSRALGAGSYTTRTVMDYSSGLYGQHFSRKFEYEADRGGLIGMAKAGYRVESAAEMMQVLLDRYGSDRSLLASWFGSHPNTGNRVQRLKQMGEEIKKGGLPEETETEEDKKQRR
jgi:predicted Zn-dependent protease